MFIDKNNFPESTPIQMISSSTDNRLYIKRDDFYPFSFGGNKARKCRLFFEDILRCKSDYLITYGSSSSNHCRIVANMAAANNIPCLIISPEEKNIDTANKKIVSLLGATYRYCPVTKVAETIDKTLAELKAEGRKPYFIPGGGHGNIGTQAYVEAYEEILEYERKNKIHFDYIFFASGTGTTHAGMVCGQYLNGIDDQKIIGISIARRNPRGKQVVLESIEEYLGECAKNIREVYFDDRFIGGGYGVTQDGVYEIIRRELSVNGIPLDATYTGKAFWGMEQYLLEQKITGKNILFIHTGGTPLFFDVLECLL